MDIEIQTYWNVETLYYVFNAVASMMAGAGFSGLLKLVFLFAIAIGMFGYMNKQLEMAKWFIHALAFVTVLNLPIVRVALTDKSGLEPPRTVDHVPFALAVVGQTTNLVFGALTNAYETVFGVPEDLGLQKGDVAFGHRILKQVNNATVRDPGLRSDLMQFIKECTLYDVKDGAITPQQIVGGIDTWNVIFNNTSPARFVTYDTLTNTATTDTCTNVAVILKGRVNDAVIAGQTFYGKQAFTRATSDAIATNMFVLAVGTSYDWILNNASNASDAMKQAMFNNIWREAGTELPALLNDPARVAEVNALASSAQAARQADGANSTLSLLAQETLPHMRNWIEAIIYGLFPVVVVLVVVSSTEGAKKIVAGYLMSLAWIGLWPVLFAVINHLSLMHLRYKARALELASGVPFQLSDAYDATLSNEQAVIGYMVVLVPFIAGGIIRLGQGGFLGVADRMMTGFSAAGQSIGAGVASGNMSMGHVGMDTASVNTTAMHKFDSNIVLQGGGSTMGRGDGSLSNMAANGAVALQQLQNRMLTQMNTDHRLEAGRNQEAHRTSITSTGDQISSRHGDASTLTDVKGHDVNRGHSQQTGVQVTSSSQGSTGGAHVAGQSLGRSARENSGFTMQAGAYDNLGMSLGFGRSKSGGSGTAPASAGSAGPDLREEKRIAESMKQGGADQAQIDQALQNYRTSKGGTSSTRSPGAVSASLGFDSKKSFGASHMRSRESSTQHGRDESVRIESSYQETEGRTAQGGTSTQASQTDRHGRDASRSNVDEVSQVRDVSDRREFGAGDRLNRSESSSFTTHKDLLSDPYLFAKVACRNGMTAMRFANQAEDRILQMVQDYVGEKGMVQQASRMPQQTFSGESLPASGGELGSQSARDRATMPTSVAATHQKKVARTGYGGTAPLQVDTSLPVKVSESRSNVKSQLDPNNAASIPSRAAPMDENVNAWASPDKKVGEGRANPLAVVEDMEGRDIKDTALKVWDRMTGGDGTADGEKLNDNQRRENGANVSVGSGVKE
jgi:conjugal transfer mating pair stabilization protein TraG